MNEKKFCFISCISDDEHDQKVVDALSQLQVPEGYEIEYLGVRQATSIASGYNEAIDSTDALIKIFFDENIDITCPDILFRILSIYGSDPGIDIIGVCGTDKMPIDMVMQHGIMYGVESDNTYAVDGQYKEVLCTSEDFFVTRNNFRFPENEGLDNYFHNIPLCAKILQQGRKIVVSNQDIHWTTGSPLPVYSDDYENARKSAYDRYSNVFRIDKKAKRLGVVHLQEMSANDYLWALLQTRHDVEIIDFDISIYSYTEADVHKLTDFITSHHMDALFTYDFCPAVSKACQECNIKYISWIYDAPQEALYGPEVKNTCNYIFSFDKNQVEATKMHGGINVFHQPLATNTTRMSLLEITPEDVDRFSCDISFVGTLYSDSRYEELFPKLSDKAKAELKQIETGALGIWDREDHISGILSPESVKELMALLTSSDNELANAAPEMYINALLISRHLANCERNDILSKLYEYKTRLYTRDKDVSITRIEVYSGLDYQQELPKAYKLSKINLNITLHTITSGIPLRVFDIMGAGGFMLTNYQPEIDELFTPGKDIEIYHTIPELIDKSSYYLEHEDIRKRIASNGYNTVRHKYNYEISLNTMLRKSGLN